MLKFKDLDTVTMFVGLPGSGKTTIAAQLVKYCNKKNIRVFSNVPILGALEYDWSKHFGFFDLSDSCLIFDEAGISLDNRNWDKNFKPCQVEFLKLLRHYHCKLVVFSQTWNDCDIKIRAMTSKLYIVRRSLLPFCSVAIPVYRKIDVDDETHEFKELYYKDGFIFRLFSCRRLFRPFYYKMFDSYSAPKKPVFEFKSYESVSK